MAGAVIARDWVRNLSLLVDLWLSNDGRVVDACAGQPNRGITVLGGVPNVRVIAPSRDSSSIWTLCIFSCPALMRNARLPPTAEHHDDLFPSYPGICDFQSCVGKGPANEICFSGWPKLFHHPNSLFSSLSAVSQSLRAGSKAGTGGSGLRWAFLMRVPLERQVERPRDLLGVKRQPCGNASPRLDTRNVPAIFTLAEYFGRAN